MASTLFCAIPQMPGGKVNVSPNFLFYIYCFFVMSGGDLCRVIQHGHNQICMLSRTYRVGARKYSVAFYFFLADVFRARLPRAGS